MCFLSLQQLCPSLTHPSTQLLKYSHSLLVSNGSVMSVVFINGLLQHTWWFGACCVPVDQEEVVEVEVAPEAEAQVEAEPEVEPEPEQEPEAEPEPEPEPEVVQQVVHEEEGMWHGQCIHLSPAGPPAVHSLDIIIKLQNISCLTKLYSTLKSQSGIISAFPHQSYFISLFKRDTRYINTIYSTATKI